MAAAPIPPPHTQPQQRATGRLGRFEVIEEEEDGELGEDEDEDGKKGKKGAKGKKGRKEKVTAEMKRAARKMVSVDSVCPGVGVPGCVF